MKFALFSALFLLASIVSAFHVVPPSTITTCEPLTVEYDTRTGQAPFSLSFHNDSADGPIIAAFTDITGTSFTWDRVTIPAGTNVVIVLGDSKGVGSATPVITVSKGTSNVCLDNPTSIPPIPTVTSSSPPTSTFGSLSPNSSSLSMTTTTVASEPSSSRLSSVSSMINSAGSHLSSSTGTTSTPRPTSTGGLSTNSDVVKTAGVFTIGVITAIVGALLA
ncbi:hypothetical protein BDM02DRAFT_3114934 [Thelephora ganbajun]|uniref:Uncharacterized protein n=1 Tax=Thelephora ganbajun TaxID=370292 RepID=A0ACB6ZHE5_THEGA|nr:hypothetical protein BDM02DRAFT_3114934 [Thelephora ganbajun]